MNVIHSETGKMPIHLKRKYQDQVHECPLVYYYTMNVTQAYSKMHPILQKIGVRSAELLIVCVRTHTQMALVNIFIWILQVDLKADALSFIAAEVNVKNTIFSILVSSVHTWLFTETTPVGE